jgi:predicted ATPase with chaperone activity
MPGSWEADAGPSQARLVWRTGAFSFLDKLPEFGVRMLEMLRQPLEDKTVSIGRSAGSLNCPASFTLIAAMSPSPGGYFQDSKKEPTWSTPAPLSGAGAGKRRG